MKDIIQNDSILRGFPDFSVCIQSSNEDVGFSRTHLRVDDLGFGDIKIASLNLLRVNAGSY